MATIAVDHTTGARMRQQRLNHERSSAGEMWALRWKEYAPIPTITTHISSSNRFIVATFLAPSGVDYAVSESIR